MTKLSISKAWDETKDILRRDGKLFASVALALVVLPSAFGGLVAPPPNLSGVAPPSWAPLLGLLIALIGIAGQIAMIRLALSPTVVADAIGHGFRRLLPAFVALLLFAMALAIVLVPLLIAMIGVDNLDAATNDPPPAEVLRAMTVVGLIAIAAAARFQLILPVAAAESGGPIKVLKAAWKDGRGHYWRLLAFVLLSLLLAVIVVLFIGQFMGGIVARTLFGTLEPFSLGALIAALVTGAAQAAFSAVISVMLARIYLQVAGTGDAEASVPHSAG
jgi:hypothetical protein